MMKDSEIINQKTKEDQNILNFGKIIFVIFFLAGNSCLFGYIFTKEFWFADLGFMLITYGSLFNLVIMLILLICAAANKSNRKAYLHSAAILLINIPIAILYTIIGCNLVTF